MFFGTSLTGLTFPNFVTFLGARVENERGLGASHEFLHPWIAEVSILYITKARAD